jgi:hypothetical protein
MQRHAKLGALSITLGVAGLVAFGMHYPASLLQWSVVIWLLTQFSLIGGGVLLWLGHVRGYIVALFAWGMVIAYSAGGLSRLWWILERGLPVPSEGPALLAAFLVSGIWAVAFLIVKSRRESKGEMHEV